MAKIEKFEDLEIWNISRDICKDIEILFETTSLGKRYALKHSRVMIHQPLSGIPNHTQATDIEISYQEISKLKKELYVVLSENTGQSYETIYADCERDNWKTSTEAKDYGLIDEVLLKSI
jgi:ATP-dependent Clp protease protease subunit